MNLSKKLKPTVRSLSSSKKSSAKSHKKLPFKENTPAPIHLKQSFDSANTFDFPANKNINNFQVSKSKSAKKSHSQKYSLYTISHNNSIRDLGIQKTFVNQNIPDSARLLENTNPNISQNDTLFLELKNAKKSLIEMQARNAANIKEIARLQHELNLTNIKNLSLKVYFKNLAK